MANPLSDKEKNNDLQDGKAPATNAGHAQIGAYSPATSTAPNLSAQAWEESGQKKALKETVKGRGLIRMFSRGVMGATAFALGGYYATHKMKGYTPAGKVGNWVQGIARFFDVAAGTPIKTIVNALGHDGEAFVTFRPTMHYPGYSKPGRSLGYEVTMVTFDFATMSVGDFWGRKIMHTLDPNKERPKWQREDGSINWAQALKTFGKNWWTALTYSQGEDWAVAVPYCLIMRHVGTPIIDKFVPGFRYEFDRNGNGGGMIIDDHGKIRGNFTAAGAINLWERFTTYNVGTLMFREAYNWTGGKFQHWWKTGEMPSLAEENPSNPNRNLAQATVDGISQFSNWITRSTVKAVTYMIPAVPFFWITRTPQHKYQAALIHPEKGALKYLRPDGEELLVRLNAPIAPETPVFFAATHESAPNPFAHGQNIDPHATTWGWFDTVMNPIAKASDKIRTAVNKPIAKIYDATLKKMPAFRKMDSVSVADTYINAAIAYTPYFWAKSDWLADRLDYGRMDAAVDRTIEGVTSLKPNEFTAGVGEMWQAIKRQPLKDPVREEYAQCLEATDATPSDNKFDVNPHAGESCDFLLPKRRPKKQDAAAAQPKPELNWRERIIAGKAEDKPEVGANKPTGYAEKEEMRKLLESLQPPTNSIN